MASWTCPACGRKVPSYSAACHCGVGREAAAQYVPPTHPLPGSGPVAFRAADVPRVVWVALGIVVLALLVGLWRLLQPPEPNPIPPLLGHWERATPRPPEPVASPSGAAPSGRDAESRPRKPLVILTPMPLTDNQM